MKKLEGFQRKYLRGRAHGLKPLVLIGQRGFTPEVIKSADEAFDAHELIKVKFNGFKEKQRKAEICRRLENETASEMVGLIGHTAVFFRQHKDPEKRSITLPRRKS